MSDNQLESNLPAGDVEQSTQPPSAGAGVQPPSIDVEALAKALEPRLQQMVERQWQSGKDRRIHNLEEQVGDFKSVLDEFKAWKAKGLDDDDAIWRMQVSRAIPQPGQQAEPSGRTGGSDTSVPAPKVDAQALLQAVGIDANDPEVTAILAKGGDPSAEIVALAVKRKNPPNPAAVMSTGGGGAVGGDNIDSLTEKLQKLILEPSKNMKEIKMVRAELAKHLPKQ